MCLCSIPIVRAFAGCFSLSSVCFIRLRALPLCLLLVICLRFSSLTASVAPQPVCHALFCVTILVSMVLVPCSDLRFPSRCGLPLGRVRAAAASVYLWFSGLLHVVVSILCRSPFRSSDSFASKVLLVTWSPFGMSLASFGALSSSGFWFFPMQRFLFLLLRVAFDLLQALPWYLFAWLETSVSAVSLPL